MLSMKRDGLRLLGPKFTTLLNKESVPFNELRTVIEHNHSSNSSDFWS